MPTKTEPGKYKFKTGFCNDNGKQPQCEGTKPVDSKGNPMRTCDYWEQCPCKCHADITLMYEMAGMEREEPEQSVEYLAHLRTMRGELWTPSVFDPLPGDGLSSVGGTDGPPDPQRTVTGQQDSVTDPASAPVRPVFAPTPTGRRARGQLEYDVLKVCQEFADNVYEWEYCTPKNVAERIGKMYTAEEPSTGAINAVWDRWEKLSFAVQDKKPSRFVRFTVDLPSVDVLERMKAKIKRDRKSVQNEIRRGIPKVPRRSK